MPPGHKIPGTAWAFLGFVFSSLTPRLKLAVVSLSAMTAIVVVSNMYMLYGFKLLVDGLPSADPAAPWKTLGWPFAIVVGCCLFHNAIYRLRGIVDLYSMPQVQNTLRETLMDYMLRHSFDYFHNRFSGELANKIGNVSRAYHSIQWERVQHGFIPAAAAVASSAFLLWSVDPGIVAILLSTVGGLVAASLFFGPVIGRAAGRLADSEAGITGQLVDTVSNMASVKNFDRTGHEMGLLRGVQMLYARDYRGLNWLQVIFWGTFDVFVTALVLGFIWRAIGMTGQGNMTPGNVALCVMIAWDLWWRMSMLSWNLLELAGDKGRLQEALSEILRPHDIEDLPAAPALHVKSGGIEFRDVHFSHQSGHKVFDGLNLTIRPAEKVGLVGLSGAGKTTLCQLLLRNHDIDSGGIYIDGQNIAGVRQGSLRRAIAVIPQDPSLFHRTLKENILYGRPDATGADIERAADAAQAHDFIMSLPDGYETLVGERGVKLSGGQRQRIAIARAILKDAPILVLDEATSALDSMTERQIQSALTTAMQGRTTLVIAHRLSTLAHLDRLVVLKGGNVVEEGTLEDLLAHNGHFAELWRYQADGFLPDKL